MVADLMREEFTQLFQEGGRKPWLAESMRMGEPLLDRTAIEEILPHRGLFLLLDQVNLLDKEMNVVVARYQLSRARDIFQGHFPHRPVWPGVLQVEAIAQAGILLFLTLAKTAEASGLALTHILEARFIQPVLPGGDVEIVARVFEEGLFFTVIGQCLQNDRVCSVAALRGIL